MYRAVIVSLLAIFLVSAQGIPHSERTRTDEATKIIDGNLVALPTRSGIDLLSLSDGSLVDHIEVKWPDSFTEITFNDGMIVYVEKLEEGKALMVYDLKTEESRELKRCEENDRYRNIVFSDGWIAYSVRTRGTRLPRLYMISLDGREEFEVPAREAWDRFASAWRNLFVVARSGIGLIEIYDVIERRVIASTYSKKGWLSDVSIDGDWVAYTDRSPDDEQPHDIRLWNYRTGEERLVLKGIKAKATERTISIERGDDCRLSGDTLVWSQSLNPEGERDDAIYRYSIERNETELVRKGMGIPVDIDGYRLLLREWKGRSVVYILHDLSTGKEVEL